MWQWCKCWFVVISSVWRPEHLVVANTHTIRRFLWRLRRLSLQASQSAWLLVVDFWSGVYVLWGLPGARRPYSLPIPSNFHDFFCRACWWLLWSKGILRWRMSRSLKDSKMVELLYYTNHQCRWFSAMIQSWGAQGYTDATAIVIARSCGSPLWRWMGLLGSTVVSPNPKVCDIPLPSLYLDYCGRICTVTTWFIWRSACF